MSASGAEVMSSDPAPEKDADVTVDNVNQQEGRRVLKEQDYYHVLGFSFPAWKKWAILTSIFIVQISMNFNASVVGNATEGMAEEFGVDWWTIAVAKMLFLVMYAFGCEAWAPFSEDLGRKWVMQGSLFLVNVWALACAVSPSFKCITAFRALGGLSSAGGSVTLGMVADLFEPENQQDALNYIVFSSVAGSVVGPIVGGFLETYMNWRSVFWAQLILGGVAQGIHMFVPETRSSILLDRHAQRLRKSGEHPNVYGPNEARGTFWQRISLKEITMLMWRPYKFLLTEPICLFLSLLSGFSDALVFSAFDSIGMVLKQWNFSKIAVGLSFFPLLIGYLIALVAFTLVYHLRDKEVINKKPNSFFPERRLWLLLSLVLLEPLGLVILGAASFGPPIMPWIVPLVAIGLIGVANYAIYMATIDYMVAAYGPYSASATGGNGFCRDFLAGLAALYTKPFYTNIATGTKFQLPTPTWILAGIATALCLPVYIFYFQGEWFRKRSPYAQQLANEREQARADSVPNTRANSFEMADLSA